MIRDNMKQLEAIAALAADTGARVVNFLTFNPYFEWKHDTEISFQARHSKIAPYLMRAIDRCRESGVEANVRYMPVCQMPGYEAHVYTGFQLPYDPHEWDYNSWYDTGHPGQPPNAWYYEASRRQQQRHGYRQPPECGTCALTAICDGFHEQYLARWGADEAAPRTGPPVTDPSHFIRQQSKLRYQTADVPRCGDQEPAAHPAPLRLTRSGGAMDRHEHPV
jgi:hypothetical protein